MNIRVRARQIPPKAISVKFLFVPWYVSDLYAVAQQSALLYVALKCPAAHVIIGIAVITAAKGLISEHAAPVDNPAVVALVFHVVRIHIYRCLQDCDDSFIVPAFSRCDDAPQEKPFRTSVAYTAEYGSAACKLPASISLLICA